MEKELDPSSVELMARALEKCDVVYKDEGLLKKIQDCNGGQPRVHLG